jgi:ribosomal protein S18 acetylase RimI-like enzyme
VAYTIRRAIPSDAEGIARAHVASWREAYAHFLPPSVLDGLEEAQNAERKRRLIESGESVFVAENATGIVGFAICGTNRYPEIPCDGELQAIYLHPSAYRQGIGRALLVACVDQLVADGFSSMGVYLFRDNYQAKAFYEAHGAEFYNEGEFEVQGVMYPDLAFVWPSLADLKVGLEHRPSAAEV